MPDTLAQRVRAKYPGSYYDLSDQELETAVRKKYPGVYDDLPSTSAPTTTAPLAVARPGEGMASRLLPTATATGASMLVGNAPLLSAAAGAVGGAAGEGLRQIGRMATDPVPEGPGLPAFRRLVGEAAAIPGAMLREGAIQGAAGLAGGAIASGARAAGRALMENAIRPTITAAREFPTIVETAIRERIPVGAGLFGPKGSAIALERLGEAAGSVRTLLERATAGGKNFATSKLAAPVVELIDDIAKQPLAERELKALGGMIDEFLGRHRGPLSPLAVKEIKQAAQDFAKPIYKAMARGEAVTADQAVGAKFNKAIATGAKRALEEIPGVQAGEKSVQDLIGLKRALTQSEARRLSLMAEGVSGATGVIASMLGPNSSLDDRLKTSAVGWLTARGILSPRSTSRMALAMTSAQTQAFLKQFPRIAQAVVRHGLATTQTEQP